MSNKSDIHTRQASEKALLIKQLSKTPIVQLACEKVGVARSTYYRWRKDDNEFSKEADTALTTGKLLMNDMAESQLLSAIKDGNLTAIIFWLKNQHKDYKQRVEVTAKLADEKLTPEEQQQVMYAVSLANLLPPPPSYEDQPRNDQTDAE